MSTLGARRVTDLEGTIPPVGGYLFTFHLDSGEPPAAGAATLTIGDLAIVGAVLPDRGGLDSPAFPAVVFAGGYGWRTRLAAAKQESRGNVRLSTVLTDLAKRCGETFDAPAEAQLGTEYSWTAGTRGRAVLADLVRRKAVPTWRVDPQTGRTVFTAPPALPPADARGRIVDRDLARGVRHLALDTSVAAWLPGATVQGTTIARLTLRERGGELRAEAWDA